MQQQENTEQSAEFKELVTQIAAGSEDAIWDFIQTYGPHIERFVRKRLNGQEPMRTRLDSVDLVQMVWLSFFRNRETIATFETPENLIRFLLVLARNKFVSQRRHSLADRGGDVSRTDSLNIMVESQLEPTSKEDTPSHVVAANDQLQSLVKRDRQIVEGRFHGKSFVQISQELGINERTARRAIWRLVEAEQELEASDN